MKQLSVILAAVALAFLYLDQIAEAREIRCVWWLSTGLAPGVVCNKWLTVQPWHRLASVGLKPIAVYLLASSFCVWAGWVIQILRKLVTGSH